MRTHLKTFDEIRTEAEAIFIQNNGPLFSMKYVPEIEVGQVIIRRGQVIENLNNQFKVMEITTYGSDFQIVMSSISGRLFLWDQYLMYMNAVVILRDEGLWHESHRMEWSNYVARYAHDFLYETECGGFSIEDEVEIQDGRCGMIVAFDSGRDMAAVGIHHTCLAPQLIPLYKLRHVNKKIDNTQQSEDTEKDAMFRFFRSSMHDESSPWHSKNRR